MLARVKELFDGETAKVGFAALLPTGFTLAGFNVVLNTIVLIGSAIYVWRKALKKPKD